MQEFKISTSRTRGPLIRVRVRLPDYSDLTINAGKESITVETLALIDTGASMTCISEKVVQEVNPLLMGREQSSFPLLDLAPKDRLVYHVRLDFVDSSAYAVVPSLQAEEKVMFPNDEDVQFHVIVGRDILEHATLLYDGRNGEVTFIPDTCIMIDYEAIVKEQQSKSAE